MKALPEWPGNLSGLAKFSPEKFLGSGAFGAVWHCKDIPLDEDRAVKLVEVPADSAAPFAESMTHRKVLHPNVATLYDAGVAGPRHVYLSMELCKGQPLSKVLEAGPVSVRSAQRLLGQTLRGVRAAHQQNIIHRDLKPDNIIVSPSGDVKITDFGLASELSPDGTASFAGTWQYMAPEVLANDTTSYASDIYSIGVIGLELLSGPFTDDELIDGEMPLWDRIEQGLFPPRSRLAAHVPKQMKQAIGKAMSVDPGDRPATVDELDYQLQQAKPNVDWKLARGGIEPKWIGTRFDRQISVQILRKAHGSWDVETQVSIGGKKSRKRKAWCASGETKHNAEGLARKALKELS